MQISTTKKRMVISSAICAVLLVIIGINYRLFIEQETGSFQWYFFVLTILLALLVGAVAAIRLHLTEKQDKYISIILLILSPAVAFMAVECLNNNLIFVFTIAQFWMNMFWYAAVFGVIYVLTNRIRITVLVGSSFFWLLSVVNYTVLLFRGTPLFPWDLLTVGTGLSVLGNYHFELIWNLLASTLLLAFYNILVWKLHYVNRHLRSNLLIRLGTVCGIVIFVFSFYGTKMLDNIGVKIDTWRQTTAYQYHGTVLALMMNMQFMLIDSPDQYSADQVDEICDNLAASAIQTMTQISTEQGKRPNLIVIMNESLADLSVLGDFTTNQDYMPFLHSLQENTIKGNLYTSVYGAGTCNTEFEFLTGNTMAFLPSGSRPYQQYVKNDTYSLVSTLKQQGYNCKAIHPYYKEGWDRETVYSHLGFERFYSLDDFLDAETMRGFVTDRASYQKLIELYEAKQPGKPLFLFNVTMQNHGGYTVIHEDSPSSIITSGLGYHPELNHYLSLVKESDDAFQELVEYFSQQDEPTIILMFGDHQPSLSTELVNTLLGTDPAGTLTPEQEMQKYITPFVIWANYDIAEQTIDRISPNYLSSLLLEVAGLEGTDYNAFLTNLYQTLPVVSSAGYIDQTGTLHSYEEPGEYQERLNAYQVMQYNNMFDTQNRKENVFYQAQAN